MNKRAIGDDGERLAVTYLKKNKYKIVAQNYYSRFGEIDIIAQKKGVIAFVEVKKRKNADFGAACEAVNLSKREKIIKTAYFWLSQNDNSRLQPRFDVIEVYTGANELNHIEDAFQLG